MDMARVNLFRCDTPAPKRYANYKGGVRREDGSLNTRVMILLYRGGNGFQRLVMQIRQDEDHLKRKRQHQARWG